jgi:Protein of unknown function (DUF3305)
VNTALASISVGVVVERHKAKSPWADFVWRPVSVLAGVPEAAPWTELARDGESTTYYAGTATIELHKTETTNYRDNLATGAPGLWVVLRKTESDPPYKVFTVTADPAEGEAMTESGVDLVEQVPMPEPICAALEAFIAEHHVERPFYKRPQTQADPEALARRVGLREDNE